MARRHTRGLWITSAGLPQTGHAGRVTPPSLASSGHRVLGGPSWRPGQPLDKRGLARLAAEQFDLLTHAQCRAAGLGWKVIDHRVRSGRWTRAYPGVYLTRPGRDDPLTTMTAALLAVGEPSALSHESAAYLHGLRRMPPQPHLLVPAGRAPAPPGVVVHRTRHLEARVDELAWPWRTGVEHTVLDCADLASMTLDEAVDLVARACAQRLTTPTQLGAALAGRARHRLRADLVDVLTDVGAGAESVLEVRFVRGVLRPHGLPEGVGQHGTAAGRHDRVFHEQRLVVELDGRLGHAGWAGRQRDSRRDRRAGVEGWFTTRGYWTDVVGSPCVFAGELDALLTGRGWLGAGHRCGRPGCRLPE